MAHGRIALCTAANSTAYDQSGLSHANAMRRQVQWQGPDIKQYI